jgi:hypothetical protein
MLLPWVLSKIILKICPLDIFNSILPNQNVKKKKLWAELSSQKAPYQW